MTDDDIIAALKTRRHRNTSPMGQQAQVQPVLTAEQEAASLAALGFRPPELLLRVYREVGNGGFGPGYGLLGLQGGWWAFRRMTAVGTYLWLRQEDDGADLLPGEDLCDPEIREGMLPICHLGCGIYDLVHMGEPGEWLWTYDPADDSLAPCHPPVTLRRWFTKWIEATGP